MHLSLSASVLIFSYFSSSLAMVPRVQHTVIGEVKSLYRNVRIFNVQTRFIILISSPSPRPPAASPCRWCAPPTSASCAWGPVTSATTAVAALCSAGVKQGKIFCRILLQVLHTLYCRGLCSKCSYCSGGAGQCRRRCRREQRSQICSQYQMHCSL